MNFSKHRHLRAALTVVACLAAASAFALPRGYHVTQQQETGIHEGMTRAQVRALLGHPSRTIKYRNQPGPTLTYDIVGTIDKVYDVDFGADGLVRHAGERFTSRGGGDGIHTWHFKH